jgi:hypothetical protein
MRGGGGTPTLPESVAIEWARAQRWAELCAAGRCWYAGLDPAADGPPFGRRGDQCPGYAGSLGESEGRPLVRVRICPRRGAWWRQRRIWLREQRAADRARSVTVPRIPRVEE